VRHTLAWLTLLVAAWGPIGHAAEESPRAQGTAPAGRADTPPTFRAGIDLVTVDVTVLDHDGRPVQDLKPEDFTIKIDGTTRRVVAAEFIKAGADTNIAAGQRGSVAFDAGRTPVRSILIAIDQLNIPPGSLRPLLDATGRFIDALPPKDRVGLVTFPGPGPRTDFVTDRAVVKKAMQGLIGSAPIINRSQLNIGLAEARVVNDRERNQLTTATVTSMADIRTPIMRDVAARNCEDAPATFGDCVRQIISESGEIAQRSRADARSAIGQLESIVESLTAIDGAKTMVLVSASLAIDEPRELEGVIARAQASRTSFGVLVVDPFVEDGNVASQPHDQSPTINQDRRLRSEGLEELAADGRGSVYRIAGRGDGVFDRIALEMSASYVLGVESVADDARKTTRKLEVAVTRQGVRVQNRQAYLRTIAPKVARPIEETLRLTLEAGSALSELPVRLATFSQWDAESDKVRVSLTADLPQDGGAGEIAVGYVVMDAQNTPVAQRAQKQTAAAGNARDVAPYGASLLLDPGTYSLRFSVVDADGKRASIVRPMTVSRTAGTQPATSDLIVGNVMSSAETPSPSAAPRVRSGVMGAYLELYSEKPEDLDWTFVHIDVARTAESAALATADADMADGARPSWRIVKGAVDVKSLPPGGYVARVRIVQDDKTVKVLTQAFVIER
jgi:VWFA-related protein